MSWKGKVYDDATLPFGLRSAPNQRFLQQWLMHVNGSCNSGGFTRSDTTWMILLWQVHQKALVVRRSLA